MKEGHDIIVDAPVSEKLYFNLIELIVPVLSRAFGYKQIAIDCHKIECGLLKVDGKEPWAVGTGCSLGVDSFGCILYYTQKHIPENYRVNCLTYFNIGAHGNDTAKATASYEHDLPMIEEYAACKKLPLVTISSNIGLLYEGWNFDSCHNTRNIATVLALQKLFKTYIYASGIDVSHLKLSNKDVAYFETAVVPNLSTENTTIMVGQPSFSRIDKTRFISKYEETHSRLYVCWKMIAKNNFGTEFQSSGEERLNCGHCEKCRRTMLALYLLGKEELYTKLFDWPFFHNNIDKMVGYALANRNRNMLYQDLVTLMHQRGYKPSFKARVYAIGAKLNYRIHLGGLSKQFGFGTGRNHR